MATILYFVKTHLKFRQKCPDFKWSGFRMAGTIQLKSDPLNAGPFEIRSSKDPLCIQRWSTWSDYLQSEATGKLVLLYLSGLNIMEGMQWGSENQTCPVFEWLTLVRISNGPVFKWFKNKMAAKWPRLVNHSKTGQNVRFSNGLLAQTILNIKKKQFFIYKMVQANSTI